MKLRSILILALALVFAFSAFAEKSGQKRTLIIKDGKVITDNIEGIDFDALHLDGELLGGKRAFLGVSVVDLTPELREHYGTEKDSGVLVASLEDNGPAEKAGVKVGDIITAIDGNDIASSFQIRKALRDKKTGDSVRIDVLRGRTRQTIVANVVERENAGLLRMADIEALRGEPGQWRTRVSALPNCVELQSKIKELEAKMKELEKKLQK
jgi:membrane-associated protease RseP (regulator of RpoE activity)